MKSYNHLWEVFTSDETIEAAIKKASKGKQKRKRVRKCLADSNFKNKIKTYSINFHNRPHNPIEIYDGICRKKRTIIVPTFEEQVIHHMIVLTMMPLFTRGMYEHSYGSIPNRGGHKGAKRICKWIKHGGRNCKYVLKMDIKKYFDSIPHEILLSKLRKHIRDERFMRVLEEVISVTEKGIPLGFYLSQWLANWYLQDLDHYIKEKLGAKYYMRYMDDMVIFGSNKRELHKMRYKISEYLETQLGLTMKYNWQVYLFHYIKKDGTHVGRFLDFMGFRFYRNRITLRKNIMIKATRKARHIYKKRKLTIYEAKQMLSYIGWIDATNTYQMYLVWVKPYVNIQQCKRRISAFDRKENIKHEHKMV